MAAGMHNPKATTSGPTKTPVKTKPATPRGRATDGSSSAASDDDEVVLRPHGGFDIV